MMRWVLPILGLVCLAPAQGDPRPPSLFMTVRPQLSITVKRDPNGSRADLVDVMSIDADYPPDQLKTQILALGAMIKSEPRGLELTRHSVSGDDGRFTSIMARFAVDNLIDRTTGKFHLTELVQSFGSGSTSHPVTGLSINFVGEKPKHDTLLAFGTEKSPVQIQGDYNPTFGSIEYRVKLNTKSPAEIQIPEGKEQFPTVTPSNARRVDGLMIGLLVVAALAVGALVYSLLSRTSASKRS
jgi:hypothetical protein